MSKKEQRNAEEAKQEPADPTRAHGDAKAAPDAKKKPSTYEFKVLPANPKNAFDFEDVADK